MLVGSMASLEWTPNSLFTIEGLPNKFGGQ
jgi:hypothetical protein